VLGFALGKTPIFRRYEDELMFCLMLLPLVLLGISLGTMPIASSASTPAHSQGSKRLGKLRNPVITVTTVLGFALGKTPIFRRYEDELMFCLMLLPLVLLVLHQFGHNADSQQRQHASAQPGE
jgi:membrane protein DedA with SNARE-associated domain